MEGGNRLPRQQCDVPGDGVEPKTRHHLQRGQTPVNRADGECPGLEAPCTVRIIQLMDVEGERVLPGKPSGDGRLKFFQDLFTDIDKCEPGRPDHVFDHPGHEKIDTKLLHIKWRRSRALIVVQENQSSPLMASLRDLLYGKHTAVFETDMS